jgi:hypothetical protein
MGVMTTETKFITNFDETDANPEAGLIGEVSWRNPELLKTLNVLFHVSDKEWISAITANIWGIKVKIETKK